MNSGLRTLTLRVASLAALIVWGGTAWADEPTRAVTFEAIESDPLPTFEPPAPGDAELDRWSHEDLLGALLEANVDVRRAQLALREAELQREGADGFLDPVVGGELTLQRTAQPIAQGLGSGLNVSERYALAGSYARAFAPGTSLTLGASSAVTRSRFPFRASLGSTALVELLVRGLAPDEALAELEQLETEQRTQTIVDGPNFENALSIGVEQDLLRGFGRDINLAPRRTSAEQVALRDLEVVQRASARALESLTTYGELRYAWEEFSLRTRALERTMRQLEIARAEVAAGQIAPIELDLVRQQIAANQEAVLIAHGEIVRRSRELRRLVGASPDAVGLVLPSEPLRDPEHAVGYTPALCEDASAMHPDLRVAEQQVVVLRSQVPPTEDAMRPELRAGATLASTGLDPNYATSWADVMRFRGTAVVGTLRYSDVVGGRGARAQRDVAQLAVERAELEVDALRAQLCFQVREAVDGLAVLSARAEVAAYRVEVATRALEAETQRFAQGLSTVQLGMDALTRLEEAEVALLRVRTDAEAAGWQLEHLRGLVSERIRAMDWTSR